MPNARYTSTLPPRHGHGDDSDKVPAISRKPKYSRALKNGMLSTGIKRRQFKIAEDAFYLDTSDLTIMQVCEKIKDKIHDKGLFMEQKEVAMDAVTNSDQSIQTQLPEEYLNFESPEVGTLKEGRIIAITDDSVLLTLAVNPKGVSHAKNLLKNLRSAIPYRYTLKRPRQLTVS